MKTRTSHSSMRLKISSLPRTGKDVTIVVDEDQRRELASELELHALDDLDVHISAWPWGKGGVKLSGDLHASVVQLCVVTFRPVSEDLAEQFVRTYLPQRELDSLQYKLGLSDAVEVNVESDDPPEPLTGDYIDLRAIIVEELTLALNPYPRHADAEATELPGKSGVAAQPGPFDALKKMTDGGNG